MKALLLGLIATLATGCMAGAGYSTGVQRASASSAPPPSSGPRGRSSGPAYAPGEDQHWFSDDDYLVAPGGRTSDRVQQTRVAKMTAPPAEGSNGEARFLVANGRDLWTDTFFRSRVAGRADLGVGALVFCHSSSAHRTTTTAGPRNKQEARNVHWYLGPITDTSDAYKGRISVGPRSCPIEAVRVPIR